MTDQINREAVHNQFLTLLGKMLDAHPVSESLARLIHMAATAAVLGSEGVSSFRAEHDVSARQELMRTRLQKKGFNRFECQQAVDSACSLHPEIFQSLCDAVEQGALPSSIYAAEVYSILHSTLGKLSSIGPDLSVAELAVRLVSNGDSLEGGRALILGRSAIPFVLRSSEVEKTRYEGIGPGDGENLKRQLCWISGADIDFSMISSESFVHDPKAVFSSGYLSDAWGLKLKGNTTFGVDIEGSKASFGSVSSEVSNLERMLQRVEGKLACIVPPSWLSKTSGADLALKQRVLKEGHLQVVIQLPDKLFGATSIAPAMLIFDTREKTKSIQFIQANGQEFARSESRSIKKLVGIDKLARIVRDKSECQLTAYVDTESLISDNCNLDVKRHVAGKEILDSEGFRYPKFPLESLVEVISCQSLKNLSGAERDPGFAPLILRELSPANIDEYGFFSESFSAREIHVAPKEFGRAKKQTVRDGDVLLAVKGSVGKCALVSTAHEGFVASQAFVILRPLPESVVDSVTLFRFIRSDLGQAIFDRVATGASVQVLKMADLKALNIPVPSAEEKRNIAANHRKLIELIKEKQSVEQEISKTLSEYWSLGD
ncbi:type I restriction-modification system subunit M/S [Microbulbifer pacificus]|uniref:site-specific DNA-methyltransferase (adenine-specific) n=1 Tax=Microbulbifer pacificus TaxID=407164 RepID=A0AAU0MXD9_9GAMM|nr:N-6 DNA methylase [Microbulbifer pacificus]WOX04712.1 N-6 DNA methylase [Microbulbifer pacificus]